jgi:trimeric autotransporter adhesin
MMKIFTMRVKKIIMPVSQTIAADEVTFIGCTATTPLYTKNCENDPVMAGSFSFLHTFISHTNKNLFMKTLLQHCKRSVLVLSLLFAAMLFAKQSLAQGSQTFNTAGTFTFTVPAGVTSITVSTWGGGGAGGGVTGGNPRAGGGGEGGSFVRGTIAVTPGTPFTVVVGSGGTASTGNGTSGGSSTFGSGLFTAIGGAGGVAGITGSTFGTGGNTANTGNIVSGTAQSNNYGGDGGGATNNNTASSGGGGGSAGAGGGGGNGGTPLTAGTAGAAGSPSAPGAVGGVGRGQSNDGAGNNGNAPGAGGSGGRNGNNNTTYNGGAGGAGQVIVTWTCPTATISYSLSPFCKSSTSGTVTINGSPGGTFSSTAGLTINSSTGELNPSTSTPGTYTVQYQIAGGSGCSAVNTSTSVVIRSSPVTSVSGQSDPNCFAGSDGSITISATGGTGPYFYSVDNGTTWTPAAQASPFTYGGLSANTQYRIRVKDSNGCLSK